MADNMHFFGIGIVLILLLVLLNDPFMLWMPAPIQMTLLLVLALAVVIWAGFVFRERPHDEREALHAMHAGRIAYLSGMGVLAAALLIQGFMHAIDPWVTAALGVMVITKLAARWYVGRYR